MSVARRIFRHLAIAACFGVVLADSVHGGNKMDSTYLYEEKDYQARTVSLSAQTFKISLPFLCWLRGILLSLAIIIKDILC